MPIRRSLLALALLLALAAPALAAPVEIAVQGRLTTAAGTPVADGGYPIGVALYAQAQGGTPLHTENFLNLPVQGGVWGAVLGAGLAKLDTAVFTGGPVWVAVTVAGEPELPRVSIRRVPNAIHALTADLAADLACSGCVEAADLADAAVTSAKIATGAVQSAHVQFAYAGADEKGGSANHALTANNAKKAELAEAALELQCTGCVTATMLGEPLVADLVAAKKLAKVAVSGAYADLQGGPDLSGYGALTAANAWTAQQQLTQGAKLGAALDFAQQEARFFRFHNSAGPPVACDAKTVGLAYFDTQANHLAVCSGKEYVPFAYAIPPGSENAPGKSCKALLTAGVTVDGTYWLDPDGSGAPLPKLLVYCDQTTDGGGWALVANVHPTGNQHVASTGAVNLASPVPVPYEDAPGGRKLADDWIKAVAEEGTIRVRVGVKASPKYRVFFQFPAGIAKLDFTCKGQACPRIITSHVFPYVWESSSCTGIGKGYLLNTDNYWVFDNHDNSECGSQFSSSKYAANERVLYYYTPNPGGIYNNQAGYTWAR